MKTRDAIYSKEAAEILRTITTYKTLKSEQVYRLFPGRETKIKTILTHLIKQGRIFYDSGSDCLASSEESARCPDIGMIAAFWVLLDFIDRAEYHTASDFPVKISLFADGEMYEIVHIPRGQEAMVTHALSGDDPPHRIILLDGIGQITNIDISNIAGYCLTAPDGAVSYYQRKLE